MATNTTNYDLIKPEYADAADIADINSNMDVIDGAMNDNATAISSANTIITAHSQSIATNTADIATNAAGIATNAAAISSNSTAIAKVQNGLAYIVGDTNTTGNTLNAGQFVYVKNHSTINEGLRKVSASIVADGAITTNNTTDCSEGGLNALHNNLAVQQSSVTVPSGITQTINVVAKQLNVVCLNLACSKTQWAEGDLIATLPAGYRPTNIIHTFAVNYNMSSDNVQVTIGTDGQIKIWNKGTQAAGNIYLDASWFIEL